MRKYMASIVCILLLCLCSSVLAAPAAVQPTVPKILKPPSRADVLRKTIVPKTITTATAPGMSLVWHGSMTNDPQANVWLMAVDNINGGRIFTSHMERRDESSGKVSVLRAVAAADGTELWRLEKSCPSGSPNSGFYAPISVDGKLLVGCNGKMQAYDPASSAKLWETQMPAGMFTSWGNSANGVVYHSVTGKFCAVQVSTGNYLWTSQANSANVGAPAVSGVLVYLASDTSLTGANAQTGQNAKWTMTSPSCCGSTPLVAHNTVYYAGKTNLYYLDPSSGTVKKQIPVQIQCSQFEPNRLTVNNDTLCLLANSSTVIAYDNRTGVEKWRYTASGLRCAWPPAVVNDVMFLPGSKLTAINMANGSKLWEYDPNKAGSFYGVMPVNNGLITAQFGTEVYVFAP